MIKFILTILILYSNIYSKRNVNAGKNPPDQVMYRSINFDQVPDPTLSWVGSGFFSQYTISNTGQSGVFEPPPGWDGYNGEFPVGYGAYMAEQVNSQVVPINFIRGVLACGLAESLKILIHQKIVQLLLGTKLLKMFVLRLQPIILK